ncbi:Two-component response regulator-like PRR95 [Acorus calamus]|uniref:Two-component response regulator-like PRR95 n=1 Tax=Acorus calamus TaxID=4465 RepID=A0AAV9DBL0_ACOCL|nr:Two-component response regulator-like PRR95 [Acorus calamus]
MLRACNHRVISVDTRQEIAMQSLQAGACYFIMKPISKEEVNNLWQHVYRKHLEQPADGFGCERCARGVHSTRNDRRGGARGVGGGREAVWEEGESSSRKGKSKYKIIKKAPYEVPGGLPGDCEKEVK